MEGRTVLIAVITIVILFALGPKLVADMVEAVITWISTFVKEVS